MTANTIHSYAASGQLGPLQQLLDEDEELLDARDENKRTPLMVAVLNGEATVGSMLAECGADLALTDGDGNSALHLACAAKKGRLACSMLLWAGAERDVVNAAGETALHVCCRTGAKDCAWLLLENGAEKSKEMKDGEGLLPIEVAKKCGHDDLVELIQEDNTAEAGA